MAVSKLSTTDIKKRLNNIKVIYQDYLKKIRIIRKEEKEILADLMKKEEEKKIEEIRNSINK